MKKFGLISVGICIGCAISFLHDPLFAVFIMTGAFLYFLLFFYPCLSMYLILGSWGLFHELLETKSFGNFGSIDLSINRLIGILIIVGLGAHLVYYIIYKKKPLTYPIPLKAYSVFALWIVLNFFLSPDFIQGTSDFIRFLSGFVILLISTLHLNNFSKRRKMALVVFITSCIGSLVNIYFYFTNRAEVAEISYRNAGTLGGYGATSSYFFIAIAFSLYLLVLEKKPFIKTCYLLSTIIIAFGLISTITRAAIIALVVFLIIWAILYSYQMKTLKPIVISILLLCFTVVVALSAIGEDAFISRFADIPGIGSSTDIDKAGMGRITIWKANLNSFSDASIFHKIFGQGLHSSFRALLLYTDVTRAQGVHNLYIWLLSETGIGGLLLYLIFIFATISYLIKSFLSTEEFELKSLYAIALAFFFSYQFVIEMFLDTVVSTGFRWLMLTFLGMLFAINKRKEDSLSENISICRY